MVRTQLSILAIIAIQCLSAQFTQPEFGPLFLQDEVARIDIFLPADSVIEIYEDIDYSSVHEYEATFVYTSSSVSDTIQEVGFRLRGNTSLLSEKKSFKVSFNSFTSGGMYQGVEKLNLNGEHNDVSFMRSKLCWDLLRERGLAASRTSYVALYINDAYYGLYLNVEHIDEEFVKKRYSEKTGNLYKCLSPARLTYLGSDPDAYKFMEGGRRIYELGTNNGADDYRELARFITVLNNTSDSEFACEIEKVFNVDDYLKRAAFDVLVGNWDGYIFGMNNYYLYEDPRTGRMEFLNYDLDNTLGIDFWGLNWTGRDIYTWGQGDRPLYDRLMADEKYREQFSFYIQEWIQNGFNEGAMTTKINALRSLIAPYVEPDVYFTLDYGFTYDDFLLSASTAFGDHVNQGLLEFVAQRVESASIQVEPSEDIQVIVALQDSLQSFGNHLIRAWVEGVADQVRIEVLADGSTSYLEMYDDGLHLDGAAGDGQYAIELTGTTDYIEYRVEMNRNGVIVQVPCTDYNRVWFAPQSGPIFINELMPSNSTTISDEVGEFDDWIELYNASVSSVSLSQLYLTDDIHCPDKWRLPAAFLTNFGFQLIWADNDDEQGAFHSNFKLSAQGEELALFIRQEGALRLLDYIPFGPTQTDHSIGRAIDGEAPWVDFWSTTPDASNSGGMTDLFESSVDEFQIWPNPYSIFSSAPLTISLPQGQAVVSLVIVDAMGRVVHSSRDKVQGNGSNNLEVEILNIESLSTGLYTLILHTADGAVFSSKLIIQ